MINYDKLPVPGEVKSLLEKIPLFSIKEQDKLLESLNELRIKAGLGYTLLALYRQQVNSGFILNDLYQLTGENEKKFLDPLTGISFYLQWNPGRELRKNHQLLIERNIIAGNIDDTKLINKDNKGKPCYLCWQNIALQNPGEVVLETKLAEETFYLGANFANLTDNHFTLMNEKHQPQGYRKELLRIANDFVDETGGLFRAMFNGLAGSSIKAHEHLQATTEMFPVEKIKVKSEEIFYETGNLKISCPYYYLPLWIVESQERTENEKVTDKIINHWQALNGYHTENIISLRSEGYYRTFIFLRDERKLTCHGKKGSMAVYESAGRLIFSYEPKEKGTGEVNEKETFDTATLETVKNLLREVSPSEEQVSLLKETLKF